MRAAAPATGASAVATYALRLGDDCLVLAQRLGAWVTRAPEIEEDVALANIGLDLLGQATALLAHAGALEGRGRDEDALAYLRDEGELLNCHLVELENGDFAHTIARQLLFSTHQLGLYRGLAGSTDPVLAGVATAGAIEVAYHRDHAELWTLRLGDGTDESHRRMQVALDDTWPYAAELFDADEVTAAVAAAGVGVDPAGLETAWRGAVEAVVSTATLSVPVGARAPGGGRRGLHTRGFGPFLAEMQQLHRAHPGARW